MSQSEESAESTCCRTRLRASRSSLRSWAWRLIRETGGGEGDGELDDDREDGEREDDDMPGGGGSVLPPPPMPGGGGSVLPPPPMPGGGGRPDGALANGGGAGLGADSSRDTFCSRSWIFCCVDNN